MKCQMPNCKENACDFIKNDSIFMGLYIGTIAIWTCKNHSQKEIENYLKEMGEKEASNLQIESNPFSEVKNLCKEKTLI